MLRAENEKLRGENVSMREAIKNASCPHCGGPATMGEMSFDEQQLRLENARIREEVRFLIKHRAQFSYLWSIDIEYCTVQLERVSALATKYMGRPLAPMAPLPLPNSSLDLQVGGSFGLHQGAGSDLVRGLSVAEVATRPGGLSEAEKPMVYDLAAAAMDELVRLAQEGEPLWMNGPDDKETLNYDEYVRSFPRGIGPKPFGLKTEATRASGLIMMNSASLVETLMDHVRISLFRQVWVG
jgi:homeobox-leucine zipper protein